MSDEDLFRSGKVFPGRRTAEEWLLQTSRGKYMFPRSVRAPANRKWAISALRMVELEARYASAKLIQHLRASEARRLREELEQIDANESRSS